MSCPAQDRGLSKGIKYSYTLFGVGEVVGDALIEELKLSPPYVACGRIQTRESTSRLLIMRTCGPS
jgi:hypothetical protein